MIIIACSTIIGWFSETHPFYNPLIVAVGGLMVLVLAIGPKVRDLKAVRERWIFLRAI